MGITLRKTDLGFPLARDLVVTHERRGLSAYVPAMREEGGGNDVVRAEVLKAAGNELFQNGHFKDAVEQYNDAIELNPEVKASPSYDGLHGAAAHSWDVSSGRNPHTIRTAPFAT